MEMEMARKFKDKVWNGNGMKFDGNGMEVLSEKKSTPDGTEKEWKWNGNGMDVLSEK